MSSQLGILEWVYLVLLLKMKFLKLGIQIKLCIKKVYIYIFVYNDQCWQEIVIETRIQAAKGQYGLCHIFLTYDKNQERKKKSLSENNGGTVSQIGECCTGDM